MPKLTGFALWNKAKLKKMAAVGGKLAHEKGTAHTFSHQEAVLAGKKGAEAARVNRMAKNADP